MRGCVVVATVAAVLAGLADLAGLAGCAGSEPAAPEGPGAQTLSVSSPAFEDGGEVPVRYTCDGAEVSPPLSWSGVPDGAAALALVVDDPDAPGGGYTHWVVVDLPTDLRSVPEAAHPPGTTIENSSGDATYAGPCPPSGVHHYRFTVYALSGRTGLASDASLDDAYDAIESRTDAWGRLVGTYSR